MPNKSWLSFKMVWQVQLLYSLYNASLMQTRYRTSSSALVKSFKNYAEAINTVRMLTASILILVRTGQDIIAMPRYRIDTLAKETCLLLSLIRIQLQFLISSIFKLKILVHPLHIIIFKIISGRFCFSPFNFCTFWVGPILQTLARHWFRNKIFPWQPIPMLTSNLLNLNWMATSVIMPILMVHHWLWNKMFPWQPIHLLMISHYLLIVTCLIMSRKRARLVWCFKCLHVSITIFYFIYESVWIYAITLENVTWLLIELCSHLVQNSIRD